LEIVYFETIDSTHKYLLNSIKSGSLSAPILITANRQEDGVGSRGNRWVSLEGNLFLSFCVDLKQLPKDLPIQSTSIYFAYLLKEVLAEEGSKIWVKWPNDFYIKNQKAGGVITVKISDKIICSIGLNIKSAPDNFAKLDINIDKKELIEKFIKKIRKNFSWKQVFSKYKIEFQKAKEFSIHYDNQILCLQDAMINEDGSIDINGKKIYSLR